MRSGRGQNFDGKRVQANRHQRLHGIIHKPVLRNPASILKLRGGDTDPEVGTCTKTIGACMPNVVGTFVDHFKCGRVQCRTQQTIDRGCV